MKTLVQFLIVLLLFCNSVNSKNIAIGVSPSILSLGTLERGSDELVKFYVVTPYDDTILVYLDKGRGTFDFFGSKKYESMILNYSEEDVTSWIKILNNPVELKKSSEEFEFLNPGVKGHRDVNIILNIPENAEPGYHLAEVIPSPVAAEEVKGAIGTQMVAVSPVIIFFNIQGNAVRDGKILDIDVSKKVINDNYEVNVYFLNSGTVTISARATKILIKDKDGNVVTSLASGVDEIKPGQIKALKSYISTQSINYGTYDVFAEITYGTGSSGLNSVITLEPPSKEKITAEIEKPKYLVKWWMIVLLIVILLLIYRWLKR